MKQKRKEKTLDEDDYGSNAPRAVQEYCKVAFEEGPKKSAKEIEQAVKKARANKESANGTGPIAHTLPQAVTRARNNWKPKFLNAFAVTGIVSAAARQAGVHPKTVYSYLDRSPSPKFLAKYAESLREANDVIRAAIWEEGVRGVDEPLWMNTKNGPVKVDTVRKRNGRIMEFIAKSRMRDEFGDKVEQELTGKNGAPLIPTVSPMQVQILIPNNFRNDLPSIQIGATTQSQIAQQSQQVPDVNLPSTKLADDKSQA